MDEQEAAPMQGWMLKKGAKGLITLWKKRWFVMEGYKLYYYKNKDAESLRHPLGYIDCSEVTEVTSPVQKKTSFFSSSDPQFQLVTPTRTYELSAPSATDAEEWKKRISLEMQLRKSIRLGKLTDPPEPADFGNRPKSTKVYNSSAQTRRLRFFLAELDLAHYTETFEKEEIDLPALAALTESDLQGLGLPLGPRKKIIEALANKKGSNIVLPASSELGRSSAPPPANLQSSDEVALPTTPQWIIEQHELMLKKRIGEGAYGSVMKGSWRNSKVAVKHLRVQMSLREMDDFKKEAAIMQSLRPHHNIVLFFGVCVPDEKNLYLVTEYCQGGSVYDLLHSDAPLELKTKLQILKGAAAGMLHLHRENLIHRDLAARNLLLTKNGQVKVGDFGMSRLVQNSAGDSTATEVGPLKWMAPEAIGDKVYSQKTDVWSYGVTCWEVVTREEVFAGMDPVQAAIAVDKGKRLPIPPPPGCPAELGELMRNCWDRDPELRPGFDKIIGQLEDIELRLRPSFGSGKFSNEHRENK